MPHFASWIAFALIVLGMVLTPGPNMIYLVSRSICQGPVAGLASLGGVAFGFLFYMLCAAFGITALVIAVFLARRPTWLMVQRWLMATVLAGLAVRMTTEARR